MSIAEINLDSISGELLEKVQSILAHSFYGQPYLFSRLAYGDELTLHFGTERGFSHPKLKDKVRGTYVLSVRGSAWILRSGIKPIVIGCGAMPASAETDKAKPFNATVLESGAMIGQGATVTKATPIKVLPMNSIGLAIELSDGSSFMILPVPFIEDKEDDGLPEPADWELLTPDKVLRVGPGSMFSFEDNSPKR